MIFPEDIMARASILALAICGFLVANHIYKHKKANAAPLVCPIKFDCSAVVHSDYSKFLGIPLEIFGMIYYAVVALGYIFLIFSPEAIPENLLHALVSASCLAFLFSLYLIGLQIFVLKKGCSWCIVSALICLGIFLLTLSAYGSNYIMQGLFG